VGAAVAEFEGADGAAPAATAPAVAPSAAAGATGFPTEAASAAVMGFFGGGTSSV
jgi:hypothetical protein